MKLLRSFLLALAVALVAACGLDGSNLVGPREDSGKSVTEDRRDPADDSQPDSTPTPDAVIAEDVRPSTDNPVVIIDAGTDGGEDASAAPVDNGMMSSPCWEALCGQVLVINIDGTTRESMVNCPPGATEIGLNPLSCVARCNGDGCSCQLEDSENITAVVMNNRESGACGTEFSVNLMRDGMIMPRTSGISRIRPMP
jgi:predicted small lipoprotein YifL